MKLNFYKLKFQTPKIKRVFFYNPNLPPKSFANNLKRTNGIYFYYSNDLVWTEIPDLEVKFVPDYVSRFIKNTEIVNDKELFVRAIYNFISKLFKDNEFVRTRRNDYLSLTNKFLLDSKKDEVSCHVVYSIKLHELNGIYLLTVNPRFRLLSSESALKSKIKGAYVMNIKSGKTYPYKSGVDGKLVIEINKNLDKEVYDPELYYFNYNMVEAEKYGFSKGLSKFYKEKLNDIFENLERELEFLKPIICIEKPFEISDNQKSKVVPTYEFKKGISNNVKNIFVLKPYSNSNRIKLTFVFKNEEQFKTLYPNFKRLLKNSSSVFYETISALGFEREFLKNPKTEKAVFYYDNFDVGEYDFGNEKIYSIIILDKYSHLMDILNKLPDNFIPFPILWYKLASGKTYLIKSFVYKFLNFTSNAQPYILIGLSGKSLYIGFDTSHNHDTGKSTLAFSAVDNFGKIIYINKRKNLELNEKLDEKIIIDNCVKSINKYRERRGFFPENVFIMRDGIFHEDLDIINSELSFNGIKTVIAEINKNSNINSSELIKGCIIKLEDNHYVYFPENYNLQKAVEINIVVNDTKKNNFDVAKEIYLTTRLFHQTPYTNLKLPFPLYITDKVSLENFWNLYIPYFKKRSSSQRDNRYLKEALNYDKF